MDFSTLSVNTKLKKTQARVSLLWTEWEISLSVDTLQYVWKWSEVCKFRIPVCRVNGKPVSPPFVICTELVLPGENVKKKKEKR